MKLPHSINNKSQLSQIKSATMCIAQCIVNKGGSLNDKTVTVVDGIKLTILATTDML